ncbi:zinc finger CCCH domain-containing protein 10-like [Anneissia japonica]|uniref:zinc finger CCCH domain-containing protein 10-like n=1 Tax=Anneissia japonica TaxID=1529436 RepID=UPI0014256A14|nr:zinc finger CCCH domain-containing protein 10-like [Anneissia japonica]XP_033113049.1 zinc finger CCCH domain-containing protein 10-like [Anneissia japonica]XP_033113050.1 zinc finger CCCH domain-containing protein 10-like [Anneissia japonica]XP_033113051.1 zinc finger CCCH domain-containing protein 10-like [Anneissia japonica]XP_033113052.1 zinc finger CCCH domain-containing protein 10-like [Anneissia japonica]XP_033113053.1 zinc finger CCCH domain-containing protein 10-like [Anneissia jap
MPKSKEMEESNNESNDICRDFQRNVCTRGKNCKYRHPDNGVQSEGVSVFCHDYQNRECRRINCKFVHCSREEEEYYRETGKLPPGVEDNRLGNNYDPDDIPICRDYLKGDCSRGMKCKYRHISQGDYEYEQRMRRRMKYMNVQRDTYDSRPPSFDEYEYDRMRRRYTSSYDMYGFDRDRMLPGRDSSRELEEENFALRRRVEELKKKVNDLTAANEVLLDQNACLRTQRMGGQASAVKSQATHSLNNSTAILSHATASTPAMIIGQTTAIGQDATAVALAEQNQLLAPGLTSSLTTGLTTVSMGSAMAPQVQVPLSVPTSMVSYPIVSQGIHNALTQSSMSR